MSLTKKVAYNTIVQVASRVLIKAISLVTIGYLTRYLGTTGFGEYTTVFAYLGFFSVLIDFGLYPILVREIAKNESKASYILGNIAGLRIVLSFLVLSVAFLVSLFLPYSANVKFGITVAAFSLFFTFLNQIFVGIFQVRLRMDLAALGDVLGRIVVFSLVLLFIYKHLGFLLIISTAVFGNLAQTVLSFLLSRKYIHFNFTFDFSFWRKIFKITLPLAVVSILGIIHFKVDTLILSLLKPASDVGIYGAPYKILEVLISFPAIFVGLIFPTFSRLFAQKAQEDFKRIFQKAFDFLVISAIPVVVGIFVLAGPIMDLIAGKEFAPSSFVLKILTLSIFSIFLATLMNDCLIAVDLQKKLVRIYLVAVIINVCGNIILIPLYSYYGAAIMTVITESLILVLTSWAVFKFLKLRPSFSVLFKSFLSAFLMGIVLFWLSGHNLFLLVLIGFFLYFGLLYSFGGMKKELLLSLIKRD